MSIIAPEAVPYKAAELEAYLRRAEALANAEANTFPADHSADDRIQAAALLNEGRDDHEAEEATPVDALVEPNPRDEWPAWVDEDRWAIGPESDEWFDALYADRLDSVELDDFDMLAGRIG